MAVEFPGRTSAGIRDIKHETDIRNHYIICMEYHGNVLRTCIIRIVYHGQKLHAFITNS